MGTKLKEVVQHAPPKNVTTVQDQWSQSVMQMIAQFSTTAITTSNNHVLKVCDWPSEVQCGPQARNGNMSGMPANQTPTPAPEGPACAPEERYNCAGSMVPVRDADDCSVFYNCDYNIQNPCPSACPPGLLYNDILKICDWPTSVQC